MGSKQKRRLARAQAEHNRLRKSIGNIANLAYDAEHRSGRQLTEALAERDRLQERLDNANHACSDLRDRMAELVHRANNPPPIIVDMESFTKAVTTLPYSRPDTGQARSDMPPVLTLAVGVAPWKLRMAKGMLLGEQEQYTVDFHRVSVRAPALNPRENLLAYRIPSGVVLVNSSRMRDD